MMRIERRSVVALSIVAVAACSAANIQVQPDAPSKETIDLANQIIEHPNDDALQQKAQLLPQQSQLKQLLIIGFRDPNTARSQANNIREDSGRETLLETIAKIFGDSAIDILIEASADKNPWVRMYAVQSLGWEVKASTPETRRTIRDALNDPDIRVSITALRSIQRRPDSDAGPRVLEIIRHPLDPHDVRGWGDGFSDALETIGATAYAPALGDLYHIAQDPRSGIRKLAAIAIGPCAAGADDATKRRAVESLIPMVSEPNHQVCIAAAVSLAQLNDPSGIPAMIFELRRVTSMPPETFDRGYDLFPLVRAIEQLTHEDLKAQTEKDQWDIYQGDDKFKENLAADAGRVNTILTRLKARGVAVDGYPFLPEKLADSDKKMFDRAFDNWLVDPRNAKYITFEADMRSVWASPRKETLIGWLFPAQAALPAQVLLADRAPFPAPAQSTPQDLADIARKAIADYQSGKTPIPEDVFVSFRREGDPLSTFESDPVNAAWLYRLGHEDIAAKLLFIARGKADRIDLNLDHPDEGRAWFAFSSAVNAYIVRADDDALAGFQRLVTIYPNFADKFGPAATFVAELQRRKVDGTFNHAPDPLPADFDQWAVERRITRLIHDLQEVDSRQQGQPGGVDLTNDPRVRKLIDIGDPAVPALIDCIEKDERLTRSVHFWRDFSRDRQIIGVREAALTAVMSVLRVTVFEPVSTGDDFTGRGQDEAKATAQNLRTYWEKNGKLPFEVRMMNALQDIKADPDAALEAAENLATFGDKRQIGAMVFTGGVTAPPAAPNPLISRFQNPTVAQAILAARDRHLKTLDPKENGGYALERADEAYAAALAQLGDASILPEIKRRFASETSVETKRRWAKICLALHDEGPMRELDPDFKSATKPAK
ncbi:MAG TPA: HEAT repeat domain-containing protein [Phycisphaerae bacterium]|jgi:hypothetical protein